MYQYKSWEAQSYMYQFNMVIERNMSSISLKSRKRKQKISKHASDTTGLTKPQQGSVCL